MLLEAAAHIKMARVQRALYQAKVDQAVQHATAGKEHSTCNSREGALTENIYLCCQLWAEYGAAII